MTVGKKKGPKGGGWGEKEKNRAKKNRLNEGWEKKKVQTEKSQKGPALRTICGGDARSKI